MPLDSELLRLVRLSSVMRLTQGRPEISIGIIDGPVDTSHPALVASSTRQLSVRNSASCRLLDSPACAHGTMVAGVLFARRGSRAPAVCPNCSLLIRPIFAESRSPSASPEELGEAIIETVNAGARVINLSSGISGRRSSGDEKLNQALSFAARHGTIVVAAAGNQSSVRGSCITQHPWVIPVVSCDRRGFITGESNLSSSIGRQGLGAPGQNVISLGPGNTLAVFNGTSAACAFVTGAIALLWSEHLSMDAGQIKWAITGGANRNSVAPPLMNAWAAWQRLQTAMPKGRLA